MRGLSISVGGEGGPEVARVANGGAAQARQEHGGGIPVVQG